MSIRSPSAPSQRGWRRGTLREATVMYDDLENMRKEWKKEDGVWHWRVFRKEPWGLLESGQADSEAEARQAIDETLHFLQAMAALSGTTLRDLMSLDEDLPP